MTAIPGMKIKKLEWGEYPNRALASPDVAVANILFFGPQIYQVQRDPWGPNYMALLAPEFGTFIWESKGHPDIEAAKAAAQADFEERILSAFMREIAA